MVTQASDEGDPDQQPGALENRAILGDRKAAEALVDAFRAYRRQVEQLERVVWGPVADLQLEGFFKATNAIKDAPEAVEIPT